MKQGHFIWPCFKVWLNLTELCWCLNLTKRFHMNHVRTRVWYTAGTVMDIYVNLGVTGNRPILSFRYKRCGVSAVKCSQYKWVTFGKHFCLTKIWIVENFIWHVRTGIVDILLSHGNDSARVETYYYFPPNMQPLCLCHRLKINVLISCDCAFWHCQLHVSLSANKMHWQAYMALQHHQFVYWKEQDRHLWT